MPATGSPQTHPTSANSRHSLKRVLAYENLGVVERFAETYETEIGDAAWVFQELKKMLWLMAEAVPNADRSAIGESASFRVYHRMAVLDEMWHTFILFTQDYSRFCNEYLGGYVHHLPTTRANKERRRKEFLADPAKFRAEDKLRIETQCRIIAEKLGPETLRVWFREIPERFSRNPAFTGAPN